MTDSTMPVFTPPPATAPAPAAPAAGTPPTDAPPWGDNFDPARAWHTIQSLREAEKDKGPRLTPEDQKNLTEYQRMVEASQTEAQRQAAVVATAQSEAETARAEALRYKVALTHGIPVEHFDLLGSGSEADLAARAAKIQSMLAAQAPVTPPTTPPPPGRPVENMRPGATPSTTETEDDVLLKSLGFAVS